jgi:hypothetical protein
MDREQAAPKTFASEAHLGAKRAAGFALAELLVSVGVLVLLVFLASQLMNTAANITTLGHKKMDADSQTRQLFDRMAIDFDHMVRRSDMDYYIKSSSFATGAPTPAPACSPACANMYSAGVRTVVQSGNDQIAFYCTVQGYGYFPTPTVESPLSIVAYRINQNTTAGNPAYLRLERMGRGLLWNAAPAPPPNMATPTPTAPPFPAAPSVFLPVPLASPLPALEWPGAPAATPACVWAASNTASWGSESEIIGPDVFRFEYYYMLKSQTDPINQATFYPAVLTDTPWDTRICSSCPPNPTQTPAPTPTPTGTPIATPTPPVICCHVSPQGMQDVTAVVVVIAVIDPKSRVLLSDSQIAMIAGKLIDYGSSSPACSGPPQWQAPGELLRQWQCALDNDPAITNLPRPAISGIRLYERYFYLRPPTLLTP